MSFYPKRKSERYKLKFKNQFYNALSQISKDYKGQETIQTRSLKSCPKTVNIQKEDFI